MTATRLWCGVPAAFSSAEIHKSLFATPPRPKTLADLKAGVRQHMKRRRAGR